MIKRIVQNLTLLAVSVLLALGVAEVVLRAFPDLLPEEAALRIHWHEDQVRQRISAGDPYLGFTFPPFYHGQIAQGDLDFRYMTDEKGFRNPSPWPAKAEILVVGDSWAFGYGVDDDETWVKLANERLPRSRMITLGLIGAAPQQYVRIYERFGIPLEPNLLIYGLFPGNDIQDARLFDNWLAAGSPGNYDVWRFFRGDLPGLQDDLIRRSYLVASLRAVRNSLRSSFSGRTVDFPGGGRLRLVPSIYAADARSARPGNPDFERVLGSVERARNLARERGTEFLVLLFPTKEEVYLPLLGQPIPHVVTPFVAAFEQRGIPYLDLTPAFQQRARSGDLLFFEIDGHANRRGYRVIADAVVDHLRENAGRYELSDWDPTPAAPPVRP
ncbi:MAG TPA: hypothetical protein VM737_05625 [Gemmatimonadota bacterium]|nr:hypothetical protein [Gemmatimonadota bacterium]